MYSANKIMVKARIKAFLFSFSPQVCKVKDVNNCFSKHVHKSVSIIKG